MQKHDISLTLHSYMKEKDSAFFSCCENQAMASRRSSGIFYSVDFLPFLCSAGPFRQSDPRPCLSPSSHLSPHIHSPTPLRVSILSSVWKVHSSYSKLHSRILSSNPGARGEFIRKSLCRKAMCERLCVSIHARFPLFHYWKT